MSSFSPEKKKEAQLSLKEVYKNAFLVGVAVNTQVPSGADYLSQSIIRQQFNSITQPKLALQAILDIPNK